MTTPRILAPQKLVKSPGEKLRFDFEFRKRLVSGDTFTGTPTVTPSPTGVVVGAITTSGSIVQVVLSGGTVRDFVMTCIANTTQGDILEMQGTLRVRDT